MRITLLHPNRRRAAVHRPDLLFMQARKEVRLAHYERFFGAPFVISAEVEGFPSVDLCVFPPNPLKGRAHCTIATDGLGDLPRADPDGADSLRAREVVGYASPRDGEAGAIRFMRVLARAMADEPRAFREWEPVDARRIDPSLPSDARAPHLLLLPPAREWPGFGSRGYANGSEVRFVWAVLLTAAERRAALADREGFLARLRETKPAPFLDPFRPSIV